MIKTQKLQVLFGGAFDPPHAGHIALARECVDQLGPERIWFAPSGAPPHKKRAGADGALRIQWLHQLLKNESFAWALDEGQIKEEALIYTVDALREIKERRGGAWVMLIGWDQFEKLDSWRDPEGILKLGHLCVGRRGASDPSLLSGLSKNLWGARQESPSALGRQEAGLAFFMKSERSGDISSGAIRQGLLEGKGSALLAPEILEDVEKRGLYKG